ncbi:hypothetical protein FGD67_03120 [Colwellia sp. M166]|nr:hypothetical protein FGD67_03120 [Colwellia sp. M166]
MKFKSFSGTAYRPRLNLCTYIHAGKALIEGNGYSLVKINNMVCKPFKTTLLELASSSITADHFLHIE